MVWKRIFAADSKNCFDPQLLQIIKEKSNEQLESAVQNAENLCTAVDSSGASLLHYAAECGNDTVAKLLIKAGTEIDLQDQQGRTPLMLATKAGHDETIWLLLENDADMNVCDENGISALRLALHKVPLDLDVVRLFLFEIRYDCTPSNSGEMAKRLLKVDCPLYVPVRFTNTDVLKHMLSGGSAIDAADPTFNRTALHVAVECLDVESVQFLVDQGANVNALDASKQTPLALIRTFPDMREEKDIWETEEGARTPGVFREQDILEILIDNGTDLTACTADGVMQMYWILADGTYEAVRIALTSKVDLQARDSHGRTAVHYLAKNENSSDAVTALEQRMSLYKENKFEERRRRLSWLEYFKRAIYNQSSEPDVGEIDRIEREIVEWNACDRDGRTALHHAMAAGNVEFVTYLMRKNVDVNVEANNGATPFIEAVDSASEWDLGDRMKCVDLVVERGADVVAEMKRYFVSNRTKSMINRHFALLKPAIAGLIARQAGGEEISEKIMSDIHSYPKLKDYVDCCRRELNRVKINDESLTRVRTRY